MEVEGLIENIRSKLDYAKMTDYDWDDRNYIWILGADVYNALITAFERGNYNIYFDRYTIHNYITSMFGIVVDHIDTEHRCRISLYKEV